MLHCWLVAALAKAALGSGKAGTLPVRNDSSLVIAVYPYGNPDDVNYPANSENAEGE